MSSRKIHIYSSLIGLLISSYDKSIKIEDTLGRPAQKIYSQLLNFPLLFSLDVVGNTINECLINLVSKYPNIEKFVLDKNGHLILDHNFIFPILNPNSGTKSHVNYDVILNDNDEIMHFHTFNQGGQYWDITGLNSGDWLQLSLVIIRGFKQRFKSTQLNFFLAFPYDNDTFKSIFKEKRIQENLFPHVHGGYKLSNRNTSFNYNGSIQIEPEITNIEEKYNETDYSFVINFTLNEIIPKDIGRLQQSSNIKSNKQNHQDFIKINGSISNIQSELEHDNITNQVKVTLDIDIILEKRYKDIFNSLIFDTEQENVYRDKNFQRFFSLDRYFLYFLPQILFYNEQGVEKSKLFSGLLIDFLEKLLLKYAPQFNIGVLADKYIELTNKFMILKKDETLNLVDRLAKLENIYLKTLGDLSYSNSEFDDQYLSSLLKGKISKFETLNIKSRQFIKVSYYILNKEKLPDYSSVLLGLSKGFETELDLIFSNFRNQMYLRYPEENILLEELVNEFQSLNAAKQRSTRSLYNYLQYKGTLELGSMSINLRQVAGSSGLKIPTYQSFLKFLNDNYPLSFIQSLYNKESGITNHIDLVRMKCRNGSAHTEVITKIDLDDLLPIALEALNHLLEILTYE